MENKFRLLGYEFVMLKFDSVGQDDRGIFVFRGIKQVRVGDKKISFKKPLTDKQFIEFVCYADNAWLL